MKSKSDILSDLIYACMYGSAYCFTRLTSTSDLLYSCIYSSAYCFTRLTSTSDLIYSCIYSSAYCFTRLTSTSDLIYACIYSSGYCFTRHILCVCSTSSAIISLIIVESLQLILITACKVAFSFENQRLTTGYF